MSVQRTELRTLSPPLQRWERMALVLFALLVVAFGAITELRSCYQHTRKTDLGVYLRAAYAVRSGGDIYQATDNNNYHYTYPPAFAVAMTPLADAPAGESRNGLLPYPLTVALWTILNFLLVARIMHVLAALALPQEVPGSRRWWYARTVPVYVATGGLFYSIGVGQVNVLVIAMLVEMLRSRLTGKSLQSGCWLAAAIVLKVIPAYLLLYPLMMRDKRAGIGVVLGLFVGLVVVPVAGLGVAGTEAAYSSFANRILLPGVLGVGNPDSPPELLDPMTTDSQSFLAAFWFLEPATARLLHIVIAGVLTLVTLFVAWRTGLRPPTKQIIFVGMLMLLMAHIAPVSHMHYYAFGLVLAAGLWLKGLSQTGGIRPDWRATLPLVVWGIGTALPFTEIMPFEGEGVACSVVLWIAAIVRLGDRDAQFVAPPAIDSNSPMTVWRLG